MADQIRLGTILVVDNDANVRSLAKKLLGIAGHIVITAANGEEGLRCYENIAPALCCCSPMS